MGIDNEPEPDRWANRPSITKGAAEIARELLSERKSIKEQYVEDVSRAMGAGYEAAISKLDDLACCHRSKDIILAIGVYGNNVSKVLELGEEPNIMKLDW